MPNLYIFVFWKSLQDTSLPLAELQAVIRYICEPVVVEFVYPEDILIDKSKTDVKSNYVAIAPLAQSAIVSSSQFLNIDQIVARCGYLHSGGPLVLAKQWREVTPQTVQRRCRAYLKQNEQSGAELIWYSKSDEKQVPKELQSLLIDDTRYHLGDQPFRPVSKIISDALRKHSTSLDTVLYAYRD